MKSLKDLFKKLWIPALASTILISTSFSNLSDYITPPTRLDSRLQTKFYKNDLRDKIAILVSTTSDRDDINDLEHAYKFLLKNHYEIFTLTRDGYDYKNLKVDDRSKKQNLERLLNYLSRRIDKKDLLFFYITGHGRYEENLSTLRLPDGLFDEEMFDFYLSKLDLDVGIVLFDICCTGNFTINFNKNNYVVMSCSKDITYSLSFPPLLNTFGRNFIKAFYRNKNGRVTIDEAFEYASKKSLYFDSITKRSRPLIKSELDPSKISLE